MKNKENNFNVITEKAISNITMILSGLIILIYEILCEEFSGANPRKR